MSAIQETTKNVTTLDCYECNLHQRLENATAEQIAKLLVLAGQHKCDFPLHVVYFMDKSQPPTT